MKNGVPFTSRNPQSMQTNPDKVQVLNEPREFYEKLLELVDKAQSRISLASLYLGSDELELELVRLNTDICALSSIT